MALIQKNKVLCIVPKVEGEVLEHYTDRCNFIISQPIGSDQEFEKVVDMSRVYANNKYLGCEYDEGTIQKLGKMIGNSYIKK